MNRGSLGHDRSGVPAHPCFNEAPIHESGKYIVMAAQNVYYCRFNEAPIHESGKLVVGGTRVLGNVPASMRPRFMNRGSHRGSMPKQFDFDLLQ